MPPEMMSFMDRILQQNELMHEVMYYWRKVPEKSLKQMLHDIKVKIGKEAVHDDAILLEYLRSVRRFPKGML